MKITSYWLGLKPSSSISTLYTFVAIAEAGNAKANDYHLQLLHTVMITTSACAEKTLSHVGKEHQALDLYVQSKLAIDVFVLGCRLLHYLKVNFFRKICL